MLQSKHTFHIKTNLVIPDKQTSTLFVVDLIDLNLWIQLPFFPYDKTRPAPLWSPVWTQPERTLWTFKHAQYAEAKP